MVIKQRTVTLSKFFDYAYISDLIYLKLSRTNNNNNVHFALKTMWAVTNFKRIFIINISNVSTSKYPCQVEVGSNFYKYYFSIKCGIDRCHSCTFITTWLHKATKMFWTTVLGSQSVNHDKIWHLIKWCRLSVLSKSW